MRFRLAGRKLFEYAVAYQCEDAVHELLGIRVDVA